VSFVLTILINHVFEISSAGAKEMSLVKLISLLQINQELDSSILKGSIEWGIMLLLAVALELVQGVLITASGLQGEKPLVTWNKIGKGSRQIRSVTLG